jgi:uncharacterized protein (UPF0264 family)
MTSERRYVRFLASVTSVREAGLAALAGADIIDCKDPAAGALGALPVAIVGAVRAAVPRQIPVSATIGDLASEPASVARAVIAMAASGVDFVKVGLFPGGEVAATLARLGTLPLEGCRLVGVLLADLEPDFAVLDAMRRAGFAGAMLDTAEKKGGSLLDHLPAATLSAFIDEARGAGLFAGLAGALRLSRVPELLRLGPDVLGFRGALCRGARRDSAIDAAALQRIRAAIPRVEREGDEGETSMRELAT